MITRTTETLTPLDCERILNARGNNRPLSLGHVERLRASMRAGAFHPEVSSPIVFDHAGRLVGGQHRLTAQMKEGITLKWAVVRGVPTDLAEYIDQDSKPQHRGHVLAKRGLKEASARASVVREMMVATTKRGSFSMSEMDEFERVHQPHIAFAMDLYRMRRVGLNTPFWAAVALSFTSESAAPIAEFVTKVCRMEELVPGTPAHALTRWLANHSGAGASGKSFRSDLFLRTSKAIAAHINGVPMTRVHGRRGQNRDSEP